MDKTNGERIIDNIVALVFSIISVVFFALYYWAFRNAFDVSEAWAAGAAVVFSVMPTLIKLELNG